MSILFRNNASGTLSQEVSGASPGPEDTTLVLQSNEASLFPPVSDPSDEFFYVTIEDVSGNIEIVKVIDNDTGSDTLTVVRGQENTTSQDFAVGSKVECRPTAGTFDEFVQRSGGTMTGTLDFDGQTLRDPVITNTGVAAIRGVPIRGSDNGTDNEFVVPASGGAPTIGNEVVIHQGNDDAYVKTTYTLTGGQGIAALGDLSTTRTVQLAVDELAFLTGNNTDADDRFLVFDADVNQHKQMRYREAGIPITTSSSQTYVVSSDDMNTYIRLTHAAAGIDFQINTGISEAIGNVLIVEQVDPVNQVTVTGSATVVSAFPGKITRQQYSVIVLVCTSVGNWTLYGDAE